MPSTPRDTRAQALLKRASNSEGRLREIIDAAADLFDRRGYHSVSMEDIAEAVGLRKPSLYHYVKSKDEVLALIHHEFMALVFERQAERTQGGLAPEMELLEFMADMFGLMESHRGHVRVFFEHHRELPPKERKRAYEERRRYSHLMQSVIQAMAESGRFRVADVPVATLAIFGMCNWAYQWFDPHGLRSPRDLAELCWDLVLNGMRTQPADPLG